MKQKMLNWIYKAIRYSYNTIISCISKNQTIKLIMAYRDIRKQHLLNEEKHISNFLKPIYYIIRYDDVMSCGWTVWERVALYGAIYAEDHHMIPVMDMQSKSNMYLEDWEIGEKNAWEKYYFQLGGVSYEDAIKSNNFILADSSQKWFEYVRMRSPKRFNKDYLRKKYNQYIRLNGITLNKLEENYKQIIPPEGGKIAGLCVRGTDYRLFHHPLQPDTSILVDETKHVMKEYDCKYVFVATEDYDILHELKTKLPSESILYFNAGNIRNASGLIGKQIRMSKTASEAAIEYLTILYILNKCDCLIGGKCGATIVAEYRKSPPYSYINIIDLQKAY